MVRPSTDADVTRPLLAASMNSEYGTESRLVVPRSNCLTTVITTSAITSQMPMFLSRLFKQSSLRTLSQPRASRPNADPTYTGGQKLDFNANSPASPDSTPKSKHDSRQTQKKRAKAAKTGQVDDNATRSLLLEALAHKEGFAAAIPRRLRLADVHLD